MHIYIYIYIYSMYLLNVEDAGGIKLVLRDDSVRGEVGRHPVAVPRHGGDARLLREEDGADLVSEHAHHCDKKETQ